MKNKKKMIIIIIIIAVVAILLIGGGTTAIVVSNQQVNSNTRELDIDDNQTYIYDGEEKSPEIDNLEDSDIAKVVYSYSEKKDDNPLDDTFIDGLPSDAGTYYVKSILGSSSKITTMTIKKAKVEVEELSVIYNQPLVSGDYFTSEMKVEEITFNSLFVSSGEEVLGEVSLSTDALSPSITSYDYTFTPTSDNYEEYKGTVDITVYAMISIYNGEELMDYLEVPYNSSFTYDLTQRAGYEMPYFLDKDSNTFEIGTKVVEDIDLYFKEDIINYSITYNLDGGINGENPKTYTINDEIINLAPASKEGYSFVGWYTSEGLEAESLITSINPNTLKNYELYAEFKWIKINPTVEFNELDLVYNGEAQKLVSAVVDGGTITYSLNNVTYSEAVPTGTNANEYTIYYKIKGDEYHLSISGSTQVVISKATYDMSSVSMANSSVTYDGLEHGILITGELPDGVTASYTGLGINAGEYTITASFTGDSENYELISNMSATLTILKADVSYTLPLEKNLVYTGEAQELAVAGTTSTGTLEYSLDDESYSNVIPTATNIGSYVVYYRFVVDESNYNSIPSGYLSSFISKGELIYTLPTANNLVYTGEAQELVSAGSIDLGTIEYSLDASTYSEVIPTGTNAGAYTIYYRYVYDTTNYAPIEGGSVVVTISKADTALTAPVAKNLTYTGAAQELVEAGSVTAGTLVYSLDNVTYSEEIPTGTTAGTYTVYYKVNGGDNYNDIEASSIEVTISKATYDMSSISMVDSIVTYDGLEHGILITGELPEGVTVSYTGLGTNAGEYTIVASFTGDSLNYEAIDSMFATLTISKATAVFTAPTAKSLVYTGIAQALVNAGTVSVGTIEYSLDNSTYSESIPTETNAGEYTVYYKVSLDEENYNAISSGSIEVTISNASLTSVAVNGYTGTYDGNSHNIVASKSADTVDGSEVTWLFSQDGTNYSAEILATETTDSGTYYYKVSALNHNDTVGTFVVVISEKTATTITIANFDSLSKTYDGEAILDPVISTNSDGEITVSYSSDGVNYSLDKPITAGEYNLKVEIPETSLYTLASQIYSITISKKEITLTGITIEDKAYDGTATATITNYGVMNGVVDGDSVSLNTESCVATFAEANVASNITVTITGYALSGEDSGNYSFSTEWTTTASIEKANATFTALTAKSLTYNGSAQELVNAGTVSVGTVEYSLDDSTYSEDVPTATNAGTYTVYYRVVLDETKYNTISSGSVEVEIAKATVTLVAPTAKNLTYTGEEQELVNAGSTTAGTIEYSLDDSTYSEAIPTATAAGTYTVYYRFVIDSTNYDTTSISDGNVSVTISKAAVTATNPTAKSLTYTGTAQALVNAGSVSVGTVEYSLDDSTYSEAISTATNAGTYTVYYRYVVDSSYDTTGISNGSVEVTIAKASATLTLPTAKELTYTGSAQTLINAGSTTEGTLEYSLDNSTYTVAAPKGTDAGSYTVYYRFTLDTANYDTNGIATSGSIAVTIAKASVTAAAPSAKSLTYTGSAQALINAGSISVGTITYSTDGENYSDSIPTATTAGSYTVYYKYTYDTLNYEAVSDGSVAVTIAKATPSYTVPTGLSATPSETLADITLPTGFAFEDALTTSVGEIGDNVFTVSFTPTDTTNYNVVAGIEVTIHVSSLVQLKISAEDNQATTYNASTQGPAVTVMAGSSTITSGYTLSYAYMLSSASSYTSGLPTNAGTYSIKINCSGDGYDDATEVVVTYTIEKATLTITSSTIEVNYNSSSRTWALVSSSIASGITYTGLLGSDTVTFTVNGMHNGKYMYGTVSGSYTAPTSDTIFGSSYSNVIGSTYIAYFSQSNTNYEISTDNALVKYKTALIGSTYYTIEDALATTGTITFAGDSTSASTYVATTFSSLDTSITGYQATYTISNRNIIVPYSSSSSVSSEPTNAGSGDTQGYVYSALIIPSTITMNFTNSSQLYVDASVLYSQNKSSTWSNIRGVVVNDGLITFASGCKLSAFGYVKGNGNLIFNNGASAIDILDKYDFSGGTIASNIYKNCLPFTAWSINNISCSSRFYSGATLSAFSHVVVSLLGEQKGTALIIGTNSSSNCMFKPSSISNNNYIDKKGIPSITNNSEDITALRSITGNNQKKGIRGNLEIYGSYMDSQLSISLYVTVATSKSISTPIAYMNIILKQNTNMTLSNSDYLFLPGCSLIVEEGATLATSSGVDLAFLPWNYFETKHNFTKNCIDKIDAKLINYGTLTINGNIGGLVTGESDDAIFTLNGSSNGAYTMYYTTSASPYYESSSTSLYLYLYDGSINSNVLTKITNSGVFYGIEDGNGEFGYYSGSGNITYNVNGGSESYSAKSITIGTSGYTISSSDLPSTDPTRSYYSFAGWYIDSEYSALALGYTTYCGLELYAKWDLIDYAISYQDKYDNDFTSGNTSTNSNPTTFNYETYENIDDPTNGEYVFGGWYVDSSCTTKINMLDGTTLVNYLSSDSVTLYALWYNTGTDKYVITYTNSNTDITCAATDTIVDDGYDWSGYTLPVMTGNDNNYKVSIYFGGWYKGTDLVTSVSPSLFTYNSTSGNYELELTASWLNKNELDVTIPSVGTIQTVYYISGYSFTVPSLESKKIYLGAEGLVLLNWELDDSTTYNSGDAITLTDQTTLTANIITFVKIAIGSNDYTTVTVTFTSGTGYLVDYDSDTGISSATAFSGTTLTNGNSTYVTTGSTFRAKYSYSGNNSDGKATITNTSPTTALTTSDTTYTALTSDITITPSGSNKSICVMPDTQIALSDGSLVPISSLTGTELVLSYNEVTKEVEETEILALWHHAYTRINVMTLFFVNGTSVSIVNEHMFYDADLMCFVNITKDTYMDYIGHRFYDIDGNVVTCSNITFETVESDCYSIITKKNGNCYANGMLTKTPDPFDGYFETIYQLESNAAYKEEMINTYGIFTFEETNGLCTEEVYNKFYIYYFKIFIGLGLITENDVKDLILLGEDIIYLD